MTQQMDTRLLPFSRLLNLVVCLFLKNDMAGAGEMAQWLRALTTHPKILSSIPSNHMVTHNHTHTHTHTHTNVMYAHTDTCMHTEVHTHTDTCTHACTKHKYTHRYRHTYTQIYVCTHTCMHTYTQVYTHTHTCMHTGLPHIPALIQLLVSPS